LHLICSQKYNLNGTRGYATLLPLVDADARVHNLIRTGISYKRPDAYGWGATASLHLDPDDGRGKALGASLPPPPWKAVTYLGALALELGSREVHNSVR
jgi:hypothetical protein